MRRKHKTIRHPHKFSKHNFLLLSTGLIILGLGIVLVSRASIPVYTTNWGFWGPRIRGCESGSGVAGAGIYTAQNRTSTASGAYQFLDSTWGGYKGYAKARLAPPEVQEERAYITFMARGTQPWNASYSCWRTEQVPIAKPVDTILDDYKTATDLNPLIAGNQDIAVDAKKIVYVSTPPADGLDPWVSSPVIQFLRIFGLFRN